MYYGIHMLKGHRFEVRLPESMYKDLVKKSERTGNPVSSVVRHALNDYLYGEGVKE